MKPNRKRERRRRWHREGITLLEVMIALAILGGSMAVLGEVIRLGTRSARDAQLIVHCQLHCESIMAEIAAGARLPEMVMDQPLEYVDVNHQWTYSIESEPIDQEGFLAIRVTVREANSVSPKPAQFSLVRWIIDPAYELQLQEEYNMMLEAMAPAEEEEATGP